MHESKLPPSGWSPPNLLGVRLMIDTHMIDEGGEAGAVLRRLSSEGWVKYDIADTLVVEVSEASDPTKRDALIDLAANHTVSLGPMVLNSSMLGMSVIGSEEDEARIHRVHSLIWSSTYEADARAVTDGNRSAKTRLRDTLHIANALRYAYDIFITNDQKLLAASDRVHEAYPTLTLQIRSPRDALLRLGEEIGLHRKRWVLHGYTPSLPTWPGATVIEDWGSLAP